MDYNLQILGSHSNFIASLSCSNNYSAFKMLIDKHLHRVII